MVKRCAICRRLPPSLLDDKISFHFIPQEPAIKEKWLNVLRKIFGKDWKAPTRLRLSFCSDHFLPSDYRKFGAIPRLIGTAVPSQKLVPVYGPPKTKKSSKEVQTESEDENIDSDDSAQNINCNVLDDHDYFNASLKVTNKRKVLSAEDLSAKNPENCLIVSGIKDLLSDESDTIIEEMVLEPVESMNHAKILINDGQPKKQPDNALMRIFPTSGYESFSKMRKIVPDNQVPIVKPSISVRINPSLDSKKRPLPSGQIIVHNNSSLVIKVPELSKKPEAKTPTESSEVQSTPRFPQKVRTLQDLPNSMKETLKLNKPASVTNPPKVKYLGFKQVDPICSLSDKTRLLLSGWESFALNAKRSQPLSAEDQSKIENTATMFEKMARMLRRLNGDETTTKHESRAAAINEKRLSMAIESKLNYKRMHRSLEAKLRQADKKIAKLQAEVKKLQNEAVSNPILDRMLAKLPEMGKQLLLKVKRAGGKGRDKLGFDIKLCQMCCVLVLVSRSSYKYIRKFVFNCLPSVETVNKWLSFLRVEIGYENTLKREDLNEANRRLLCKLLEEDSVVMEALEKIGANKRLNSRQEQTKSDSDLEQMIDDEDFYYGAKGSEQISAVDTLINKVLAK